MFSFYLKALIRTIILFILNLSYLLPIDKKLYLLYQLIQIKLGLFCYPLKIFLKGVMHSIYFRLAFHLFFFFRNGHFSIF